MIIAYIIVFTLMGSVGSLIGSYFLLLKQKITESFSNMLISFAAGALIATAFLDLFPEAAEAAGDANIFMPALLGFLSFFIAERYIRLFHYHHSHGKKPSTLLVLIGDGIHNFVDGVTIAAAFMVSLPLGFSTTLAVVAHEIPHELSDFSLLIYAGFSTKKALFYNLLSALTAILGAALTLFISSRYLNLTNYLLPLTAGNFIYIAASDLFPELRKKSRLGETLVQAGLIFLGIVIIVLLKSWVKES